MKTKKQLEQLNRAAKNIEDAGYAFHSSNSSRNSSSNSLTNNSNSSNSKKLAEGEEGGYYPDRNSLELETTGVCSRTLDRSELGISSDENETFWVNFNFKRTLKNQLMLEEIQKQIPTIQNAEATTIVYHLLLSFVTELELNEKHKKSFRIWNAITRDNKNYKKTWAKRKNVTEFIRTAEATGWVEVRGGYDGRCTRIRAATPLVSHFFPILINTKQQLKEQFNTEVIRMKTRKTIMTKTIEGDDREVVTRAGHPTTGQWHRTHAVVDGWTRMMHSHTITLPTINSPTNNSPTSNSKNSSKREKGGYYPPGNSLELATTGEFSRTLDPADEVWNSIQLDFFSSIVDEQNNLKNEEVWMFRKFIEGRNEKGQKNATEGGGRLYHTLTTLPRAHRARLLVDGMPTVQYDYSDAQMRLLYARGGYACPANLKELIHPNIKVAKTLMMYLIGAKKTSDRNWSRINWKLREKKLPEITKEEYKRIKLELAPVWAYLGESAYMLTQQEESEVAMDIVEAGIRDGVLVIPIHDGFIVSIQNEEWLQTKMEEIWKLRTGQNACYKKEN